MAEGLTRAGRVVQLVTVDMTSGISGAGEHSWDPVSNTALSEAPRDVVIVGQTDPAFNITWDFEDGGRFRVADVSDGSDAAAGADAGKVRVRVRGY